MSNFESVKNNRDLHIFGQKIKIELDMIKVKKFSLCASVKNINGNDTIVVTANIRKIDSGKVCQAVDNICGDFPMYNFSVKEYPS